MTEDDEIELRRKRRLQLLEKLQKEKVSNNNNTNTNININNNTTNNNVDSNSINSYHKSDLNTKTIIHTSSNNTVSNNGPSNFSNKVSSSSSKNNLINQYSSNNSIKNTLDLKTGKSNNSINDVNKDKHKNNEDEDEDEDDMFSDTPPPKTTSSSKTSLNENNNTQQSNTSKIGKKLDSSLLDNWDDPDGYYRIIPGEILDGKYLVGPTLGQGTFATVVRATNTLSKDSSSSSSNNNNNNFVAIKIIRNNETMTKAGLKELALLEKIKDLDPTDRNHIVRLKTSFDHKNHLCLVFENLESNLRDIIKKFGRDTGINIIAIKSYTHQLLSGLSLLRGAHLMHADIKPDNILVNKNHSILKICDLGSATDISENDVTPYLASRFYRAPELILGIPHSYAIDMWSVGCTLYELYTGKVLFPGTSNNNMLKLVMETKGKFSHKMIKKGQYSLQHFSPESFDFLSSEIDPITHKQYTNVLQITGPNLNQTIKSRLSGMEKQSSSNALLLNQFIDLLDSMLSLNPEKRPTPSQALQHSFLTS